MSAGVRRPQQGIALVLVLWVMVLLMVIAASLTVMQRNEVGMAAGMRQEREARAAIAAAQQFMIYRLLAPSTNVEDDEEWKADGVLRPWQFEGRNLQIAATPENGRIDLNLAPSEMLDELFAEVGLEESQAESLRDAILDWKDPDDAHLPNGAEDDDYEAEGLPYGAKDGRFDTLEELRQVMGVTAEIYHAVLPALTIHSGQRTVNPIFAQPLVLYAIPNADRAMVDQYIEERNAALAQDLDPPMPTSFGGNYISSGSARVYRLYAEAEVDGERSINGEIVVTLGGGRPRGGKGPAYTVLETNFVPLARPIALEQTEAER